MKALYTIKDVRKVIKEAKSSDKTIGFVPTMGFLHRGHLSLIERAREENDLVIVSIFVNPTQFGPNEDFESYPRSLDQDSRLVESMGTDFLFLPSTLEMYPIDSSTNVEVEGDITKGLCGTSRPGHFKGVTTIVSKLFNIVTPDKAYFGQKDAQQVAVIEKMVRDLHYDIEIVPCPIIREEDGLAMSSRNTYLSAKERIAATILSKSLFYAEERIKAGERDASVIIDLITKKIYEEPLAEIDYIEIVSAKTLQSIKKIEGDVLIALAVKIGKARLIDNIRLEA